VPDPLTLPLTGTAVVVTTAITFTGIVQWFRSHSHLTAGNADAAGVLIARMVDGRQYHEVDIGSCPAAMNTRLVKVIYDERTKEVLAAEAEESRNPPDEATRRAIRAGSGLVVFR
jgi:hypothetical protein